MRGIPTIGDVSRQEWRWVAFWGGLLVTLTLIPYAIAIMAANEQWAFMGVLANPQDGATYFAKIEEGMEGNWLYELQHTPQPHRPAGVFVFYLLLGQLARLIGTSPFIIFHLARIATSLFMFTAIYRLGAYVWLRTRPRRLFFLIASMVTGLGWLMLPFISENNVPPDIGVPEAFPFYAAYANPHFPLSIGCLVMLVGIYIRVFRPDYSQAPTVENGGALVLIYAVILSVVQPPALVAFGAALVGFTVSTAYRQRTIPWHEIRWVAMLALAGLPVLVYYVLLFSTNETFREFNEQNVTPSPNIIFTIASYGVLLMLAIPAINRARKRFDRDGDYLMLLWLVINFIVVYVPHPLQRRFFIGLIIPIVYFVVRALEDYWFERISKRWHQIALIAVFIFILPSNFITLMIPLFGVVANQEQGAQAGLMLDRDYVDMFAWLDEFGAEDEVVLASPDVSLWLPAQTPLRVVYGHPYETVPSGQREDDVLDFFTGRDCNAVFEHAKGFDIDYLVVGPMEIQLAVEARTNNPDEDFVDCITTVIQSIEEPQAIQVFGDVTLYILRDLR